MNKIFLIFIIFGLLFPIFSINAQDLFIRDLYFGIQTNPEVTKLQEFLTDEGLYSGPITGNFFSLTLKAVKSFQVRENISPTAGYFGPITRIRANQILSSQIKSLEEQAVSETGAVPVSPTPPKTTDDIFNSLQSQIATLLQQITLLQQQLQTQKQTEQQITQQAEQINQQTQIIQQQEETIQQIEKNTQQIAQNTTPPSEPILPPYQSTTITIKTVDDTHFSIINNGPDTLRIKKIILLNPSIKIMDYSFSNSTWSHSFNTEANGVIYNRLDCSGLKSLGTYSAYGGDRDPCARPYSINDKVIPVNELLPNETITFRLSLSSGGISEAQGLKYESGSLIEVSTGNNVVFQDFSF